MCEHDRKWEGVFFSEFLKGGADAVTQLSDFSISPNVSFVLLNSVVLESGLYL